MNIYIVLCMINYQKKSRSQCLMIRGKAVEESLRFYLENRNKIKLSIQDIRDYALDYYFLRTKELSSQISKKHSLPIFSLVKSGLNGINCLLTKNSKLIENTSINSHESKIFPDFLISNIFIDDFKLDLCYLELKVVDKKNFSTNRKYQLQALNYAINSKTAVLLMYIVFNKKSVDKYNQFTSYSQFTKFFPKNIAGYSLKST